MLEKKKNTPQYFFDLEKELRADKAKAKKMIKDIEEKELMLKNAIRKGASKGDFEKMGVMLKAYQALHKVVTRLAA